MPLLLDLMLTFMKIGAFTFGGGYAMISIIENNCVEQKRWITHDEMMTITVIAESTPGPIAINCATFVGYKQAGFIGAVMATLGIVTPSFLIIYIISMFLQNFLAIPLVAHAFAGIRVGVGLLILNAADNMLRKMQKKRQPRAFMLCAFAAMTLVNIFSLPVSSIHILLVAAAVSLALFIAAGAPEMPAKGGAAK
ncbi:MAG: chromate transporter [Firmicutes bacterium]|nr:chromate transporter [Bacillota bacterium]